MEILLQAVRLLKYGSNDELFDIWEKIKNDIMPALDTVIGLIMDELIYRDPAGAYDWLEDLESSPRNYIKDNAREA